MYLTLKGIRPDLHSPESREIAERCLLLKHVPGMTIRDLAPTDPPSRGFLEDTLQGMAQLARVEADSYQDAVDGAARGRR